MLIKNPLDRRNSEELKKRNKNNSLNPTDFTGLIEKKLLNTSRLYSVVALKDNSIASGDEKGNIKIWDSSNGKSIKIIFNAHSKWISSLVLLEDGRFVSASHFINHFYLLLFSKI
jgi:WD40 repeat protein